MIISGPCLRLFPYNSCRAPIELDNGSADLPLGARLRMTLVDLCTLRDLYPCYLIVIFYSLMLYLLVGLH